MHVDGRCHCGAITYEAEVDPDTAGICHCTDCQTLTGTVYRVTVQARAESFVLRGTPTLYVKTADSGNQRVHAFCPVCGSPVYAAAHGPRPATYSLRVGALRQRAELRPRRQKWCVSALPWSANIERLDRLDRQ
jgi:hypothetical protein